MGQREDHGIPTDPVIEAYKKDVDRTLIRENLKLTVEQRFGQLMDLQRFAEEMRSSAILSHDGSHGGQAMTTLTVQVPDATLISLKINALGFAKEIKVLAAVKLFELGKLSSGRAAELAGMSRLEFLDSLERYNVGPFEHMTAEDIHRDFLNA